MLLSKRTKERTYSTELREVQTLMLQGNKLNLVKQLNYPIT